jgi:two-component system chemotaxis response regulator CheB
LSQAELINRIIRVLVVDDSAYVRKVVRQMLSQSPFIEVVGAARDGREALQMVEELRPDVVTSDLMMPELDGVGFVREQMSRRALPILMMSSVDENSADTLSALDAGAVDFVQKPTALATERMFEMREELIEKIKMAASVQPERLHSDRVPQQSTAAKDGTGKSRGRFDMIVLGISTGGPQALRHMIPQLPADLATPVAVVLHMPVGYTTMFAERLNEIAAIDFCEAREGMELRPGRVMLAPAGRHLLFKRRPDGKVVVHLSLRPEGSQHRPSVDAMFRSAAETFGGRTLGIVMTGMGSDGKEGSAWIKARGGTVYTESEETCVVYGMPSAVAEAGLSDKVIRLERMVDALIEAS